MSRAAELPHLESSPGPQPRPGAGLPSPAVVSAGRHEAVLGPQADAAVRRALTSRLGKLMFDLGDGVHRELMLPPGELAPGIRGTRCFMNLELADPSLPALLRPPEVVVDAIDRVNLYWSQAGTGAPLHFDTRSIWVVQLVGTKLWVVSAEPALADPHRNCVAQPRAAQVDYDGVMLELPKDALVTLLRPGDWLFVPRACWHRTYTARGSISASLAAPPTRASP